MKHTYKNIFMKSFKNMKAFCNISFIAILLVSSIQLSAQVTPPFWDNAFGTCGGWYQNGGGVKAGSDGNIYASYRYSGTISIGVPGFTASPANGGGGTSIGTGKITNLLHGDWATEVQSSGGDDYILGTGIDADLNSYAGGIISSGAGWYCGKTDVNGVLKWNITSYGAGGYASGICTDINGIPGAKGHTYICGPYNGATMNVLGHSLPAVGTSDGFVLKVNSQGVIDARCWLIPLHGPVGGSSYPSKCAMDYAGHLWVCGGYSGAPTFGSFNLPASSGPSNYNLFVAEIDTATGNVLTVYTAANAGSSSPWASSATSLGDIVIDSCNNIYVSGPFMHTATWGIFTATCAGAGPNYYVAKISPAGIFQWVETNSSPTSEGNGYYLTIDKNWDISTTGQFSGTATFGSQTITGSASGSICVAKYASGNGALMYAEQGGGASGSINGGGIAADANRQLYISGSYNSPGPTFITISGPLTLPVGVSSSIFIAKLDSTPSIKIVPDPQNTYCSGQCYTLPFTAVYDSANGLFRAGNIFTAQLSDVNGSFAAGGTTIGTLTSTTSGLINICIPAAMPAGTNYLLRVTASKPNYCSIVRCNTITINDGPTVTLSPPPTICGGSSAILTVSGGVSYTWSTGATTSSITVTPVITTIYTVGVSNGTCTKDTSIVVTVHPTPTVVVTGPGTLCSGGSGTLTATVSGGTAPYTYDWTPGTGSTSSISVTPASTQTYTVDITDANGCSTSAEVSVTIGGSTLGVTIDGNTSLCAGSSTTICATATGGTGGNTYVWEPGGFNAACITVAPGTTTIYTVTVQDNCGTTVNANITVNVNPAPAISFSAALYQGCAPLCTQFYNTTTISQGGMAQYEWSFGNGDTAQIKSPTYCYPGAGTYDVSLTVTSDSGCSSTLKKTSIITVYDHPVASFSYTPQGATILSPTVQFTNSSIDAYGIAGWVWTFGESGDSISTAENPAHTYADTGMYCAKLVVMDIHGCMDTAIHCLDIGPAFNLYIPSAFTPNGDGMNDVFLAKGDYVKSFEMEIYDRWGMQLFQSNDMAVGWNGTVHGGSTIAQQDTYVYKINVTDTHDNVYSYTGNVTLLK